MNGECCNSDESKCDKFWTLGSNQKRHCRKNQKQCPKICEGLWSGHNKRTERNQKKSSECHESQTFVGSDLNRRRIPGTGNKKCGEDRNKKFIDRFNRKEKTVMRKQNQCVLSDVIKRFWCNRSKFRKISLGGLVNERIKSIPQRKDEKDDG